MVQKNYSCEYLLDMPDLLWPSLLQMRSRSIIYGQSGVESTFWISMRRMLTIHSSALAVSSSIKALHALAF